MTSCDHHPSAAADPRALLAAADAELHAALVAEEARHRDGIQLIPSENYCFPEILPLLGSIFTAKYAEGYPGRRYYCGQAQMDIVEERARERAKALFRAEHANVQPLSGSPMNQAVYFALLEPGDTILAMDLSHGGHLTHGAPVSHMGRLFRFVRYRTSGPDGAIDMDAVERTARAERPKLIVVGLSSYPRSFDYARFRAIADAIGATTMADVSHIGGLIAAGVLENPLDAGFEVMTTTTHKSLRGPRGGLILCRRALARAIDASVFPGLQGGPHMNQIAALATALKLAATEDFRACARAVLANARALAEVLTARGARLVTGGTDNHLLVIDTAESFGLDGDAAARQLEACGITVNKQVVPDDPRPPMKPSGIRIGSPAMTTRGMRPEDFAELAGLIVTVLSRPGDAPVASSVAARVRALAQAHPVPGIG